MQQQPQHVVQPMMQPQSQPMMQPQQVVYIQTVPVPTSNIRPNFASKTTTALAAVQLTIGCLCVIFNGIAIGVFPLGVNSVGAGIWCGALFIIAGGLGLGAARSKTNCMIISFLVMSIISAVFTVSIFSVSGIEVGITANGYYPYYYHYSRNSREASLGINAFLLLLTFVELIIAIVASAVCCNVLCGCCTTPTVGVSGPQYQQQQVVQYVNQPGAVAYMQGGTPGISYYNPQPVPYVMQPNTVMVSQGQPMPATQPPPMGPGQQPTAPGTATMARAGGNTPPPAYYEDIPEKS